MASIEEIVQKLLKDGPVKHEGTTRRVRGVLDGAFVFDTIRAVYVWEHPYYPYFYIPEGDLIRSYFQIIPNPAQTSASQDSAPLRAWHGIVKVAHKEVPVVGFEGEGPLHGLVRFDFKSLDSWYVEDERIYSHPKDPYKRIECIPSSRTIRIEVDGHVVAESSNNIFLYETGLRPRYYLSPMDVDQQILTSSDTSSVCPYKGEASYYHITVNGREVRDAIWWYRYPTSESAPIAGRLCFYNEKVDVFIDGIKEE